MSYVVDGLSACDDLEHVGVPNTSVTFEEINHDCLTEEENTMFDMIEKQYNPLPNNLSRL